MQRACDLCGVEYEAKRKTSRFCNVPGSTCRARWAKGERPESPTPEDAPRMDSTDVASRVERELAALNVADRYEAGIVVGIARQLDSGLVQGTAYVSLSKEVDRRMDALRLLADRADDPVRLILDKVDEKQQHLRLA